MACLAGRQRRHGARGRHAAGENAAVRRGLAQRHRPAAAFRLHREHHALHRCGIAIFAGRGQDRDMGGVRQDGRERRGRRQRFGIDRRCHHGRYRAGGAARTDERTAHRGQPERQLRRPHRPLDIEPDGVGRDHARAAVRRKRQRGDILHAEPRRLRMAKATDRDEQDGAEAQEAGCVGHGGSCSGTGQPPHRTHLVLSDGGGV